MTERTEAAGERSSARERTGRGGSGADDRTAGGATRRGVLRATAGAVGVGAAAGLVPSAAADRSTSKSGSGAERDVMFTCNAKDGSVTFYGARNFRPIRTIDVYPDGDPDDQVSDVVDRVEPKVLNAFARENYIEHANLSPDGRTLYAARGHAGDVVAVDVESGEKLWETELPGFRADHQTISPDGAYLFTSDLTVDRVDKIDTETGRIVAGGVARDLPHGNHYHELPAFGGDEVVINGSLGNMVYPDSQVGDHWEHQLTFYDPDDMSTLRTVDFPEGVRPFAITHDGAKAYVQVSYFHGFYEYDIGKDAITDSVELPQTEHVPEDESDYPLQSAHHGIDVSGTVEGEAEKYVCVAGTTSWYAGIVRRDDLSLVDTVEVGEHPYWVRTGPDGRNAFVPVRGENEVAVVDYAAAEEVARVPVGAQPHVTERGSVPRGIL